MVILVIGGSGSGKSEYAESRCMQFCQGEKLYIATMEPYGKEGQARIARHHRLRQGRDLIPSNVIPIWRRLRFLPGRRCS